MWTTIETRGKYKHVVSRATVTIGGERWLLTACWDDRTRRGYDSKRPFMCYAVKDAAGWNMHHVTHYLKTLEDAQSSIALAVSGHKDTGCPQCGCRLLPSGCANCRTRDALAGLEDRTRRRNAGEVVHVHAKRLTPCKARRVLAAWKSDSTLEPEDVA